MRVSAHFAAQHFHPHVAPTPRPAPKTTTTSASSRSRLPQDQTFDIHFQLTVVVEVYTLFLTVEKGGLQCAAHCARLTLLEIMQELLKRQMPAVSLENPNSFCERFHHYFVILGPSI